MMLEHVVFVSYTLDIIFNFMRLPISEGDQHKQMEQRSHLLIAKKYFKSGWLFVDSIATFPFYLLKTSNGSWFKLLRMVRIPKILNLVDQKRFDQIIEIAVSGLNRDKRIQYRHAVQ